MCRCVSSTISTACGQRGRIKVKEGSLLASRAQDEYAYIAADMRQIVIVAVGLFAASLAVLGALADETSITYVYKVCAFLPAIGLTNA